MRRLGPILGAAALAVALLGEAGTMRMVVADLPYERVWTAALQAVAGYPIERAADGVIVTGWHERAPRASETGWSRVRERVAMRVEAAAERITRVTVEVEAAGWRAGEWVPIADTEPLAREVLARLRDAQG
jgi:hypothetical protein